MKTIADLLSELEDIKSYLQNWILADYVPDIERDIVKSSIRDVYDSLTNYNSCSCMFNEPSFDDGLKVVSEFSPETKAADSQQSMESKHHVESKSFKFSSLNALDDVQSEPVSELVSVQDSVPVPESVSVPVSVAEPDVTSDNVSEPISAINVPVAEAVQNSEPVLESVSAQHKLVSESESESESPSESESGSELQSTIGQDSSVYVQQSETESDNDSQVAGNGDDMTDLDVNLENITFEIDAADLHPKIDDSMIDSLYGDDDIIVHSTVNEKFNNMLEDIVDVGSQSDSDSLSASSAYGSLKSSPAVGASPNSHLDSSLNSSKMSSSQIHDDVVEGQGRRVVGDVIGNAGNVLNESFSSNNHKDLATKIASNGNDLHAFIGINDRYMLIRELFNGDSEAYDDAINVINTFTDFDECMIYIGEHYHWKPGSDGVKLLINLITRKLS